MFKKAIFLFLFSAASYLQAQTVQISGKMLDEAGAPLEYVNVAAFSPDSALISGTITDAAGVFRLAATATPAYLKCTFIGFKDLFFPIQNPQNGLEVGNLTMLPVALGLKEVEIKAERALVERQVDRLVVNVSKSAANAGGNAIEVLGRSPGVFVDINGGISLRGKGVNLMVNGRRMRLSGAELEGYLRGIPAAQIDKIELIQNPSAAFDAEGGGGIINLILKKDANQGTSGSVNASFGHGLYERYSEGLSLNHRKGRLSLTTGINHNFDQRYNKLYTIRKYSDKGELNAILDQYAKSTTPTNIYSPTMGVELSLKKGWSLGANANGTLSYANVDGEGKSEVMNAQNIRTGGFDTKSQTDEDRNSYAFNLNARKTGKKGDFSFDADYAKYNTAALQRYDTYFGHVGNTHDSTFTLKGDIKGFLELFTFQGDFNLSSKSAGRFSGGFKTSFVQNDNDLVYSNEKKGVDFPNTDFTNRFLYQENVNALYANWSLGQKKWSYQAGLRMEQTRIEGKQFITGENFSRNLLQVFPSVFLQYKHSEDFTFGFNTGRRINRPTYERLNPFKAFVDITTVREGNPKMIPENIWKAELSFNYKSKFDASFAYSTTLKQFIPLFVQNDSLRLTRVFFDNIGSFRYVGADFTYNFELLEKMNNSFSVNVFHMRFLGNVLGNPLNNGGYACRIYSDNSFSFGKGWTAELNGFYQPPYVTGLPVYKANFRVDAGLQKTVLKGAGRIRLAGSDLFWLTYPRATTKFANVDEQWRSVRDTRVGTISFSYNFGNKNVKASRKRNGAQDEKRRAS